MKSLRLCLFAAVFLAAGYESADKALGQIISCGAVGSNCYRANCANKVYQFLCCNGTTLYYNSNDCWAATSSSCVQSCWTQVIGTAHCPIAACGDDVFDKNWCFLEGCRSPVFRRRF